MPQKLKRILNDYSNLHKEYKPVRDICMPLLDKDFIEFATLDTTFIGRLKKEKSIQYPSFGSLLRPYKQIS
jgi:hypothetical protein